MECRILSYHIPHLYRARITSPLFGIVIGRNITRRSLHIPMASLGENIGYNFFHPLKTVLRQKIHSPFSSQKVRWKGARVILAQDDRRVYLQRHLVAIVNTHEGAENTEAPKTPQRRGIGQLLNIEL
jgi:hypothetical protein